MAEVSYNKGGDVAVNVAPETVKCCIVAVVCIVVALMEHFAPFIAPVLSAKLAIVLGVAGEGVATEGGAAFQIASVGAAAANADRFRAIVTMVASMGALFAAVAAFRNQVKANDRLAHVEEWIAKEVGNRRRDVKLASQVSR
jgi:hypothetical protein